MPLLVQMFGENYGPPGLAAVSLSVVLVNALTSLFSGWPAPERGLCFCPIDGGSLLHRSAGWSLVARSGESKLF